jgi:hypothetical protein
VVVVGVGVVEVKFGSTEGTHDGVKDTKLTGSEGTDHDATRSQTNQGQFFKTLLLGNSDEAGRDATFTTSAGLVDLGEQGVGRVGDNGGGNPGDDTGGEGDSKVLTARALFGGGTGSSVHPFCRFTLDGKFGHCVGDLLEEDGAETGVESEETIGGNVLGHASTETLGEGRVGDGADADSFEGAQEDVGDELGAGSGDKIDTVAVVPGFAFTNSLRDVDLEEFNPTEFEPALDEVASSGSAEARGQGPGAFGRDDLTETSNHTLVVSDRVELDASLDDVDRAEGSVSDGAADTSCQGSLKVVHHVISSPIFWHCLSVLNKIS